ncbi:hypothetical protein LCGC14_0589110 [marine sediment metagenome]|uniref:Uncharacterized protein n=1 Tax=marine sediment metagenome TaxID=412755 RepID=A0A0F9RJ23_9ZZZZ
MAKTPKETQVEKWIKGVEKKPAKWLNKGGKLSELPSSQLQVLELFTKEFLTPRKIAIRRQTTQSAVYKILDKLRKKGLLTIHQGGVEKIGMTIQPSAAKKRNIHTIRLHGEKYNIKILFKDERYKERIKAEKKLNVDGNVVLLYPNAVVVHSGQNFFGDDAIKSTSKAVEYWGRFFAILENQLKVLLVKPRHDNINRFAAHYAEINNELARKANVEGEKIKVYARDDGKLWFLIDNSFNLHEAETVHGHTSYDDMHSVVQPFFNDLRENKPLLLSEMLALMKDQASLGLKTTENLNEVASGLNILIKLNKPLEPDKKPVFDDKGKPDYVG